MSPDLKQRCYESKVESIHILMLRNKATPLPVTHECFLDAIHVYSAKKLQNIIKECFQIIISKRSILAFENNQIV